MKRREWSSVLNSAETSRIVKAEKWALRGDVKVISDFSQSSFNGTNLQGFLWGQGFFWKWIRTLV